MERARKPPPEEDEGAAGKDHAENEYRAAHRSRDDGIDLCRPSSGVRAEGRRGPLTGIPRDPRQPGRGGPQGPADPVNSVS